MVNLLYKSNVNQLYAYGLTGPVSFSYLLASGVLAVPFGILCDKYGRMKFAVLGCLAAGTGFLVLPFTSSLVGLVAILGSISAILLLVGIGHASYTGAILAYTGDVSTGMDVGQAYGLVELAEFTSFSFAPAIGAFIADAIGISSAFLVASIVLFAAAFLSFWGMRGSYDTNPLIGPNNPGQRASIKSIILAMREGRILVALVGTMFLALALQAFRNFVPLFALQANLSISVLGILVSVEAASSLIIALPAGKILDLTGRRMPVLVIGLAGSAVTLAGGVFVPHFLLIYLWTIAFGLFLGLGRVPPAVMISEGTTMENRASAMGGSHAFEHAGYAIGALLAGYLVASYGFITGFQGIMIVLVAAALGFLLISIRRRIR